MAKNRNIKKNNSFSLEFDFTVSQNQKDKEWPEPEIIPLNLSNPPRTIFTLIKKDINDSASYLIVTGFTSLGQIIDFFGCHANWEVLKKVRIVIGWEPLFKERKKYKDVELEEEVKNYWLSNRYSIIAKGGGYVIRIIELIKNKILDFRIYNETNDRLHAKIYIGEKYAQAGSANFSGTGLNSQLECMMRFSKNGTETENKYYQNLNLTAENYYEMSSAFNEGMTDLLEKLLAVVTWQEALSRAIHEILNRNSMYSELPEFYNKINSLKLWPSQKLGLHQAFMILQKNGCVLIADPTGSGKTKMITTLQMLTFNWLLETGKRFNNFSLTIAPPLVKDQWKIEFGKLRKFASATVKSMGILSNKKSDNYNEVEDELKNSNILIIDEAHNYLNNNSFRSKAISTSNGDYVILSTATPINKSARDLLRVVELLGIDNLGDEEIKEYKDLRIRGKKMPEESIRNLQRFISKIIVRRTKSDLRDLIEKEKEEYKDSYGKQCSYPIQNAETYKVNENNNDRRIAQEINKLALQLRGILYLQTLLKPKEFFFANEKIDDAQYIETRINIANKLSIYNLQATMRSSKAALLEHLLGTEEAVRICQFETEKKKSTGNVILKVEKCKEKMPKTDFRRELLPEWLYNQDLYKKCCDEEISIYEKISDLSMEFSDERELSKIDRIAQEFTHTAFIIAFDSLPITLDYLKHLAAKRHLEMANNIFVVTGHTSKSIIKYFGNEKLDNSAIIGKGILFCSDALSEGVGLQRASAMFFLDMPSVIRLAEQRIGRIERLDSSYKSINVFWPLDSDEFALKKDKRLIDTLNDVSVLIGSNFNFPDSWISMKGYNDTIIKPREMIKEMQKTDREEKKWEGIQDSFKPVFELFDEKNGLIERKYYDQLKGVKADIKLRISKQFSQKQWCFIALKSSKTQPPRWFFINSQNVVQTELPQICQCLREGVGNLKDESWFNKNIDENDWKLVNNYLKRIRETAIEHLPNKKRRTLRVVERLLTQQINNEKDFEIKILLNENLKLFQSNVNRDGLEFDYEGFAGIWLEILSPHLQQLKLENPRKIISLDNLLKNKNLKFEKEILEDILKKLPYTDSLWERITSLILAVPTSKVN